MNIQVIFKVRKEPFNAISGFRNSVIRIGGPIQENETYLEWLI